MPNFSQPNFNSSELNRPVQPAVTRRLITTLARSEAEMLEAQRLRYKVFAEEMGANLPNAADGIDRDNFDKYCDHLLVRESDENKVVGTYRILSPDQAEKVGGYYSQTEFDLTRLLHLSDRMVEVGRSCVHRDYRDGTTIAHLWGGLAQYMQQHRHEYLIGCASISMGDGGHVAASLYRKLHRLYAAPAEYSVFPRCPAAAESAECHAGCAGSAAAQRLSAAGCLYLRRTGLGSGIQHRRLVHPAADVALECPPSQTLFKNVTAIYL